MTDVINPDPKIINLLKGNTNEKRLERKLVNILDRRKINKSNRSTLTNRLYLEEISKEINKNISDNDMLFQILPDLKLAMSFLISGILSPKDLLGSKLSFSLKEHSVKREIATSVVSVIEKYFDENYNLNSLLPKILEDALFLTGSYSLLILPETEIDRIINTDCTISKESRNRIVNDLNKNLGFITENKEVFKHLTVTDNFNILKKGLLKDKLRREEIKNILSSQSPSLEKIDFEKQKRNYSNVPISILQSNDSKLIGEPIVMKITSESIVPVHVPGDPEKHIGYFILLDNNGYPVNGKTDRKVYEQLQGRLTTESEDNVRELIKQTKMAIYGYEENIYNKKNFNLDVYCRLMEEDLKRKLSTGVYGDDVEIADLQTVSKIMIARAFKEKESTLLFVPEDLLCYIAFKYNDNGIGKSLLEDTRILSSLRSVLMFSNVIASMKNSVPRTGVKIDLDETDPNPRETVEFLLNEFSRNHNMSFPIGLTNPADIVDAIQRSSIDVAVSGNAKYPETNIDVTDKTRSVAKPDSDLENQLRRRQYMAFGLPPEIIDADMNIDYAVSVITSDAMTTKEITIYQNKLNSKLKDFVVKYISNSEFLTESIISKIGKNKTRMNEYNQLIDALEITLPSPDSNKLENQMSALDTYTNGLEKALEAYINPDIVNRLIDPDLEDAVEPAIECVKTYYIRQWLAKNNVFSELTNLIDTSDPANKLRMDMIQKDHIDSLLETVGKLLVYIKKKGDKVMDIVENETEEVEEETTEENETEAEEVEEGTTEEMESESEETTEENTGESEEEVVEESEEESEEENAESGGEETEEETEEGGEEETEE